MEKRNTIIVALCGLILVAFLAVATVKILQHNNTPPPEEEKTVAEAEQPAPERRHGPRVRRKVDIGSTFSGMAPVQQDNAANGDGGHREFHEQTPEEAVESAWQALDTYRQQSEEDRNKTKFALGIVNVILNAVTANAGQLAAGMNDQQRADAVMRAQSALQNIYAIEQEVVPDMNEDERQTLGGTIQAVHNLSATFLNQLQ